MGVAFLGNRGNSRRCISFSCAVLSGLVLGCMGKVADPPRIPPGTTTATVRCHIQRTECSRQEFNSDTQSAFCSDFEPVEFDAHACYNPLGTGTTEPEIACFGAYCTPVARFPGCQVVSATPETTFPPQACASLGGFDVRPSLPDLVSCTLTGRACTLVPTPLGTFICQPLTLQSRNISPCFDPVRESGFAVCGLDVVWDDLRVLMTDVVPNGCSDQ
jgi:hypothetical protein